MKQLKNLAVLCVGAHADDLEIGMGGTIAKLSSLGCVVWYCVLTSDSSQEIAHRRKEEAQCGAGKLGVPAERVLLFSFGDGSLACNAANVECVRRELRERAVDPDVVFTHTRNDSHNDHKAAHDLCDAAFRRKLLLFFPVVNSLEQSFSPRVFVDIEDFQAVRTAAIGCHSSQSFRINPSAMDALDRELSKRTGFQHTEGFEVLVQTGAENAFATISFVNDCPFNRFWFELIGEEPLTVVHAVPVHRRDKEWNWPTDKDREGLAVLRRAFKKYWSSPDPVNELACATPGVERMMESSHLLLSGGAVSNTVTHQYFNHFSGIRYVIGFSMPGYKDIHIWDRAECRRISATYETDAYGNRLVASDMGILTIMPNPLCVSKRLIGCMGIHGFGTLGMYQLLSSPILLDELHSVMRENDYGTGLQILVSFDTVHGTVTIDHESVHRVGQVRGVTQ